MENKPFIFGVATSGDNFTDREKEAARLLSNFTHGVNTILISPRRWGKTSLVKKVCNLAQSNQLRIFYLEIFSSRTDKEFYTAFTSAVLKQSSSKFTIGPNPMRDFSISLELADKICLRVDNHSSYVQQ